VPTANEAFAAPVTPSPTFRYTSADDDFTVSPHSVNNSSSDDNHFITLGPARYGGHSFTLHGSRTVTVQTPPAFAPDTAYFAHHRHVRPNGSSTALNGHLDRMRSQSDERRPRFPWRRHRHDHALR
jgi:hypothetical protein